MATLDKGFYGNFGLKHVFKDILRGGIKHRPRDGLRVSRRNALVEIDDFGDTGECQIGNATEHFASLLGRSKKFK